MVYRVRWESPGAGRAGMERTRAPGVGSHPGEDHGELRNKSVRLFLFCFGLVWFFTRRQLCLLSPSVWKYCHSKLLLHECLLYFPLGNLCLGSFNQEQTLNTTRGVHPC